MEVKEFIETLAGRTPLCSDQLKPLIQSVQLETAGVFVQVLRRKLDAVAFVESWGVLALTQYTHSK